MAELIHLTTEQPGTVVRTLADDEFLVLSKLLFAEEAAGIEAPTDQEILKARDQALEHFQGGVVLGIEHGEELVGGIELFPNPRQPYLGVVGIEVLKEHRRQRHGIAAIRATVRYGFERFSAVTAQIEQSNLIGQAGAQRAGFFCYAGPINDHLFFAFDRSHLNRPR
jgi:RimJ/RimL family protein N-acetyltransferase